jgi:hypothetical protein
MIVEINGVEKHCTGLESYGDGSWERFFVLEKGQPVSQYNVPRGLPVGRRINTSGVKIQIVRL